MESRKKMIGGVAIVWVCAIGLYYLMFYLEPTFLQNPHLFDAVTWMSKAIEEPLYKLFWAIGDFTEGTVYKSLLASVGLLLFGFAAHFINKSKPESKIYAISYGTGNFPWIALAATVGLLVSSLLYSGYLYLGWIPTFLPGCTIPAALVVMYGGGPRVALTGGVLSGVIQYPLAYIGMVWAAKIGMPSLVLVTIIGMSLSGIIITEIFRLLPWTKGYVTGKSAPSVPGCGERKAPVPVEPTAGWVIRRTLADPTEVFFFGSEVAGIGLILGGILSWMLNPGHNSYGVPYLFVAIVCGQLMGESLCAVLYYKKWKEFGFYPTYSVAISVGVELLFFGTSMPLILVCVVLSSLICPFLAGRAWYFCVTKLPRYPSMIGSVAGMGAGIAIVVLIIKLLLSLGIVL